MTVPKLDRVIPVWHNHIGRIVVPADIRKALGLYGEIELVVTKDGLLIRNPKYKLVEK